MAAWAWAVCETFNCISCASRGTGAHTSLESPKDQELGFGHPVHVGDAEGFSGLLPLRCLIATKEDPVKGLQVRGGHAFGQDLDRMWGHKMAWECCSPAHPFLLVRAACWPPVRYTGPPSATP